MTTYQEFRTEALQQAKECVTYGEYFSKAHERNAIIPLSMSIAFSVGLIGGAPWFPFLFAQPIFALMTYISLSHARETRQAWLRLRQEALTILDQATPEDFPK